MPNFVIVNQTRGLLDGTYGYPSKDAMKVHVDYWVKRFPKGDVFTLRELAPGEVASYPDSVDMKRNVPGDEDWRRGEPR